MKRKQFIQLAIIAPIAAFFGIKALKKGSINVFLKCQAKNFTISAKKAAQAFDAMSEAFAKSGIQGRIAGENLRKDGIWLKNDVEWNPDNDIDAALSEISCPEWEINHNMKKL